MLSGNWWGKAPNQQDSSNGNQSAADGQFSVGEIVEYYSASQGGWILAKVLSITASGTYNLDCKPDVPISKVRKVQNKGGTAGPSPGQNQQAAASNNPANNEMTLPTFSPMPRDGSLQTQGDLSRPVQLLRVTREGSRWQYEVCQEGAQILEQHGARQVAVVCICGLYRTGKSYLLNLLLERIQQGLPTFQVGGTTRACTEGLWLWGSVVDSQGPLIAYIDCEGFGSTDSDQTRDAQLMTLCALLSSVLVLNTKGALNEGLFNALALTCRFAEHIEAKGNELNRPILLWILRDFMLELRDPQGKSINPDQYLEQALKAAPTSGHDNERGQAARDVRQSLMQFFSQRMCTTLVQPLIEERDLQRLDQIPYASLRPEFKSGVEGLQQQISRACARNPKAVGGAPLQCSALVALLRQLVHALNSNKALSVKGAWDNVQHSVLGDLVDDLQRQAREKLKNLAAGQALEGGIQLPMTDAALTSFLQRQLQTLRQEFDQRALGDETTKQSYWEELKEALTLDEKMVWQQNGRLGNRQQDVAKAKVEGEARDAELQELRTKNSELQAAIHEANAALQEAATARDQDKANSQQHSQQEVLLLKAEIQSMKVEVEAASAERDRLREKLEESRKEQERLQKTFADERSTLQQEAETARAEHLRLLQDTQRRMDEDRKQHHSTLQDESQKLLERERYVGVLQGQVQALTAQTTSLQDRTEALQQQVKDAEARVGQCNAENKRLQAQLEEAQAAGAKKIEENTADYERRLQEAKEQADAKPKCACVMQ